jgi:threonine dehydratase
MRSGAAVPGPTLFEDRRGPSLDRISKHDLSKATALVNEILSPTPVLLVDLPQIRRGHKCLVKREDLLPTGSFKIRGASHFLACLSKEPGFNELNIVTATTGNHGLGLAWASQRFGKAITVVVPEGTSALKREELDRLGAKIRVFGQTLDEAIQFTRSEYKYPEYMFVPSFDPRVILGHSTMGVELLKDRNDIDQIYFPIGIGTGISGLAIARQIFSPSVRLIGVVPEACNSWALSFKAGKVVMSNPQKTSATGLRTARPDVDIFEFLQQKIDKIVTVTEEEISGAIRIASACLRNVADGTGVVGLAGLIKDSTTTSPEGLSATFFCS